MAEPYAFEILDTFRVDDGLPVHRARRLEGGLPLLVRTAPSEDEDGRQGEALLRGARREQELSLEGILCPLAILDDERPPAVVYADHTLRPLATVRDRDDPASGDRPARAWSPERALGLAHSLADTLSRLHRHGVVHGALCPANVVVGPDHASVWLWGLGGAPCAPAAHPGGGTSEPTVAALRYMAPEQTGRLPSGVDERTDLYRLGLVLYDLLVGEPPFVSSDPMELVHAHVAVPPRPVRERSPWVPEAVFALVARCLAKAPAERYQTAVGLRDDLARCREEMQRTGDVSRFVLGTHDLVSVFRAPGRLFGREGAVAALRASLDEAAAGVPRLLLVSGAPGVGKSLLVESLRVPRPNAAATSSAARQSEVKSGRSACSWTPCGSSRARS